MAVKIILGDIGFNHPAPPAAEPDAAMIHKCPNTGVWMMTGKTCISAARELACLAMDALDHDSGDDFRKRDIVINAISGKLNQMLDSLAAGGVPVDRPLIHTFPCGCIAAVNIRCTSHQTEPLPAQADVKGGE